MHLPGALERLICGLHNAIESLPGMARPTEESACEGHAEEDKSLEHRASGAITALVLYGLLMAAAFALDGYAALWQATVGTFTGSLMEGRVIDHSLLDLLGALGAVATIALPLCLASGALCDALYGPVKSHGVAKMFTGIKNHYLLMTATVTGEEVFARLLFLGLPLWIGKGHLPLPLFWALFLIGNVIWALVHLYNFKDPKERHVLRTLPQFLGGVFFTVIFVNFGFFGALLVHLAFNNVLFSTMRKGIFNRGEIVAVFWHGIVAAVSAYFLVVEEGKSLLDMAYWLDSGATNYQIPGWSATDYLWGVLLVTSLLFIVGDLMQFDLYCGDHQKHVYDNLLKAIGIIVFAFGAFFGLRAVGTPFEMRVAVMAVIFMVIVKTASGSGMARAFWIGIPWLMTLLCVTLALGFASPVWFILLAVALVEAVDDVIRIWDRKAEEAPAGVLAFVLPARLK